MACLPQIRRRQALLKAIQGDKDQAFRYVVEAVEGFRALGDQARYGHALLARATVHHCQCNIPQSIEDARLALEHIPITDSAFYFSALQNLCFYLTKSGRAEAWQEALDLLNKNRQRIKRLTGLRILKLKFRWVRILVERQNGVGANHVRRMEKIFKELLALGMIDDAEKAARDVEEIGQGESGIDPSDLAALAADLALLGGRRQTVRWAAAKAFKLQTDQESPLASALADLYNTADRGEDPRVSAIVVRQACTAAPALPPRFDNLVAGLLN